MKERADRFTWFYTCHRLHSISLLCRCKLFIKSILITEWTTSTLLVLYIRILFLLSRTGELNVDRSWRISFLQSVIYFSHGLSWRNRKYLRNFAYLTASFPNLFACWAHKLWVSHLLSLLFLLFLMVISPLVFVFDKLLFFLNKLTRRLITDLTFVPNSSIFIWNYWRKSTFFHLFLFFFGLIDISLLSFQLMSINIILCKPFSNLFIFLFELLLIVLIVLVMNVIPLFFVFGKWWNLLIKHG